MTQSDTTRRSLQYVAPQVLIGLSEAAQARLMQVRDNLAHLHEDSTEADLIDALREIQDALKWRDEIRHEIVSRGLPLIEGVDG